MLRRLALSIIPGFLALAFLFGAPGVSAASDETTVALWSADAVQGAVVRGSLSEDVPDGLNAQRADEDDSPDKVAWEVAVIVWPEGRVTTTVPCADDIVGLSHRPCAAQSRAPPRA